MIPHAFLFTALLAGAVADTNAADEDPDGLVFGDPIAFHNITLVPVRTTRTGPFDKYALLEEGIAAGTLRVRELNGESGAAQVSVVEVRNTGKEPAFLLSGEMILGGKQDRILESDVVVPNDGAWTKVSVFCVEQGRWDGRKMRFSSGGALVHSKLQKAAMKGDQGQVWKEVARKNAAHGTANSTGTYRRTVQSPAIRKRITSYRRELAAKLPRGRTAGFVFAVNGKVRVADLFANPVLLDKLQGKLLSAYILEALEHDVDLSAKPMSKTQARGFYGTAKAGKSRKNKKKRGASTTEVIQGLGSLGTATTDDKTGKVLRETYVVD